VLTHFDNPVVPEKASGKARREKFGYSKRTTQPGVFSGATRRAGAHFSSLGVVARSCGTTTPRSVPS